MLKKEEVLAVADLARLELSDEEVEKFSKQLSNILDLFKEIDDIDLEKVEETSQITGINNIAFVDKVSSDVDLTPSGPELNLANTPVRKEDKILTPRVIEK